MRFLVLSLLLAVPLLVRARSSNSFGIIHRWRIGGNGSWNRLTTDPANHRLYLTRGDRIVVLDTRTGEQIGEVTGAKSARTVCLNSINQTGYFTDGASGLVRVFDLGTLRVIASIPVGVDPDAAVFDSGSNTLLVLNDGGKSATLIDASANRPIATVALPGRPASTVTTGQGLAFVGINDLHEIARVDLHSRQVIGAWPISGCSGLSGLAIDRAQHHLYAVCENNRLLTLDARNGQLLSGIGLPEGTRDVVFDPRNRLLFAASGGGTLTVLAAKGSHAVTPLQIVKTMAGARTAAVDPSTGQVYLDSAEFGLRTGETSEELRFRPTPVANSFVVLVISR
jgi:YVTN family beta-propeller protein